MLNNNVVPVILCGGSGSRLWPLSRKSYPKQFINFVGKNTLFQDRILFVKDSKLVKSNNPIILTNEDYRFIIKDQLRKNTDNLMERGGFGSPTIFINEIDMYFGNDRLQLVKEKILGNF